MFLSKFKILVLFIFSTTLLAQSAFLDNDCITADYKTKVKHKGAPFGMFDTILSIEKKECLLTVEHKKMKMINKRWLVDICREPVHIKYGTGAVDVLKKEHACSKGKSDFCDSLKTLMTIVQDDGLIFADGEKEVLGSDHGMVYCTYLLLKGYLQQETIFSRYKKYDSVLREKKVEPSLEQKEGVPTLETKSGSF